MRVSKVRKLDNWPYGDDAYRFNLNTSDGHTIIGLIYRPQTGAILPPLVRYGKGRYPAVRLDYRRIPHIRELVNAEINKI